MKEENETEDLRPRPKTLLFWFEEPMFCSISSNVPTEPVVSKKSGHVFEKKLIEKYIESEGKCPVTGEPLTSEDLLPLVTAKLAAPRPAKATSIPSLLAIFQSEWDALMLESYTLKQHLETVRQELSQALYQHDAASRVIARLIQERDAARHALSEGKQSHQTMEVDEKEAATGIKSVIQTLITISKELSSGRKKRDIPEGVPESEAIREWATLTNHEVHSTNPKGITCVDVHRARNSLIVSGGMDKIVKIFDHQKGKVMVTLKGHSKKVNKVIFHPSNFSCFSASADKTVRVWSSNDGTDYTSASLDGHSSDVNDIALHPSGVHLATASSDQKWGFYDVANSVCLQMVDTPSDVTASGYSSLAFHPDGLLLCTGTQEGSAHVWDMKTAGKVHTFSGHKGSVNSISFSENGYTMASGCADGIVKLWDLRKLSITHEINIGAAVNSVAFDYSGKYLSVGSKDVRVYFSKGWDLLKTFTDPTAAVMGVKFSHNSSFLVSVSMDKSLRLHGSKL